MTDTAPSLLACPTCDCLFVAPEAAGRARCPICRSTRSRPGAEWIARRRARNAAEPPGALALAEAPRPGLDPHGLASD